MKTLGHYTIVHKDFEDNHHSLFDKDGVHLSFIGNDIFLHTIQTVLEKVYYSPHELVYPIEYG